VSYALLDDIILIGNVVVAASVSVEGLAVKVVGTL
jgi:hypothetical protein